MKKVIILAGNKREFDDYCERNELTQEETIFAENPECLRGVEARAVVMIGTFYKLEDYKEIIKIANSRIKI